MQYHPDSVNIDDPKIRQALLDNLSFTPDQADIIENSQFLDPKFVNEVLIPQLAAIKEEYKTQRLLLVFKTNTDLEDLAKKFTFTPFSPQTQPTDNTTSVAEDIRSTTSGALTTIGQFLKDIVWMEDENEKLQAMRIEIMMSAQRIKTKFDRYVVNGDGDEYGDERAWIFRDDEENIYLNPWKENNSELRWVVEDIGRTKMIEFLNVMVKSSRDSNNLAINLWGNNQTKPFNTEFEKLKNILERLEIVESWVNSVLPWFNQKGAKEAVRGASAWSGSFLVDILDTVMTPEGFVGIWVLATGWHQSKRLASDNLLRKTPAVKHLLRKPAWVSGVAPATASVPPASSTSAPASPSKPTAPKTPKLYEKTSLDLTLPKDNVLRDMEPKSPVHKYFREVVQSELKAGGATPLQALKCKQLGDQFDLGKLSREEYFRKIFLISEGRFTFTARIKNLFSGSLWAKIRQPISRAAQVPLWRWTGYQARQTTESSTLWNKQAGALMDKVEVHWDVVLASDRMRLYKNLESALERYEKFVRYKALEYQMGNLTALPSPTADQSARLNELNQKIGKLHGKVPADLKTATDAVEYAIAAIDWKIHPPTLPNPLGWAPLNNPDAGKFTNDKLFQPGNIKSSEIESILAKVARALAKR